MTALNPIRFSATAFASSTPREISERILDLSKWTDFQGYGPLPGIRSAEFLLRTPDIIGSKIAVTNTDGSRHTEEIVEWQPELRIRMKLSDFSPPLSRLATSFEETWEFRREQDLTIISRSFELHPRFAFARPVLWLISLVLKQAIARHLRQIAK